MPSIQRNNTVVINTTIRICVNSLLKKTKEIIQYYNYIRYITFSLYVNYHDFLSRLHLNNHRNYNISDDKWVGDVEGEDKKGLGGISNT